MVAAFVKRVYRSEFLRSLTALSSGAFVAQLIPLLLLPVFSRLYAPEYFAIQGMLIMCVTFLVPLATGFYEWAVPLPRALHRARALAWLAVICTALFSAILLLLLLLFREQITGLFRFQPLGRWLYAAPFCILAMGCFSIANYWLLRRGKFALQSLNKLVLAGGIGLGVLACALLEYRFGLVLGYIVGVSLAGSYAMFQAYRHGMWPKANYGWNYLWDLARRYADFPLFGSIPGMLNSLATLIPFYILTMYYTLESAGHYAVVRNILAAGIGLFSACIGQVIMKTIADLVQQHRRTWPPYLQMTFWLFLFGVAVTVGVYIVGPWFFQIYLGKGWEESADMVRILALNTEFWLLGPTLAFAVIAVNKIRALALWQVIYGAMSASLFFFTDLPFDQFLWRIVAFEMVAYALYAMIDTAAMKRFDHEQAARK